MHSTGPKSWTLCANGLKQPENPSPQYDHKVRQEMRNSCALTFEANRDGCWQMAFLT